MTVLLITETGLDYFVNTGKSFSKRRYVRNKGDTPFKWSQVISGEKNLFSSYFIDDWVRIRESGLVKMWYDAFMSRVVLAGKEMFLRENKYFKAVQLAFGKIKEPVTFHESRRVSLELIMPAFYLSGIVVVIGVIGFMVENWMTVRNCALWVLRGTGKVGRKMWNFLELGRKQMVSYCVKNDGNRVEKINSEICE